VTGLEVVVGEVPVNISGERWQQDPCPARRALCSYDSASDAIVVEARLLTA